MDDAEEDYLTHGQLQEDTPICAGKTSGRAAGAMDSVVGSASTSAIIAGASAVVPGVGTAYQLYTAANIALAIYQAYKKKGEKGAAKQAIKEAIRLGISHGATSLTEDQADYAARNVVALADKNGVTYEAAQQLGLDEQIFSTVLHETVKGGLQGGLEGVIDYTLEEWNHE